MIAETLLIISVLINILCLIYIRSLLKRLAVITDSFEELSDVLANFSNHLKTVHELETFYGDETLHALIRHSVNVSEDLDAFVKELLITEPEENQGEPDKDVGDDTDQTKEED